MKITVKSFEFNPFRENTYIVYNENKDCLIIDPGCSNAAERNLLKNFIQDYQLQPLVLLNTHCHIDHVMGNAFVQKEWNLPLLIHSGEQAVLNAVPQLADVYGLEIPEMAENIAHLDKLDELEVGSMKFKILFTPGHSPAHISLYHEKEKYLFSGDVLFRDSIGRTDLPGGNYATLISSIETQLWKLPDATLVFPGHGPSTTIGYEKENNPFL